MSRSSKCFTMMLWALLPVMASAQQRPVTLEQFIAAQRTAIDAEVQKFNSAGQIQMVAQESTKKPKEKYTIDPVLTGIASVNQVITAEVSFGGRTFYVQKGEPIGATGWRVTALTSTTIEMTSGERKDLRKLNQSVAVAR